MSIFKAPIKTLNNLLVNQTNIIKRSLNANTFYALELYRTLNGIQGRWEGSIKQMLDDQEMEKIVAEASGALRGACLRSFPEILVDVRAPMATGPRDMSTSSIADITYTVSTNSHAGSSWLIDHNRNRRCRPSPIWKTSRRTKPLSRSYSLRSAIAIG